MQLDISVYKVHVQEPCCLLCCHIVKISCQTCVTQQADRCTGVAAYIGNRGRNQWVAADAYISRSLHAKFMRLHNISSQEEQMMCQLSAVQLKTGTRDCAQLECACCRNKASIRCKESSKHHQGCCPELQWTHLAGWQIGLTAPYQSCLHLNADIWCR